jgi:hypothetical protein
MGHLRAALHQEAGPISLEADCMKFHLFLGWSLASTTHYNQIMTGANFPICKGLATLYVKYVKCFIFLTTCMQRLP